MAEVILVYPKTGMDKEWACCLPLSLLHVASGAVKEFDLKLIDQRRDLTWRNSLKSAISNKTICVGISSMTGKQIYHGLEISKFVKGIRRDLAIVWGGIHPTIVPEQTIKNPYIDYVIAGEGEWSFLELLKCLAAKETLESVPGLIWQENGKLKANPQENSFSLDELPELPYHLLNAEDYVSPAVFKYDFINRALPYFASRGCPYKCIYCAQPVMYKSRYRKMSPEKVYQRISKLVSDYNLDCIDFYDDEFAVDAAWITRLAELIKGRFTWTCQARMDDLGRVDLEKLAKNGLKIVKAGLESGSNRILDYLQKRESTETYIAANKRLAATNIVSQYNFMIGYPAENKEDLFATIDLALRLMEDNPDAVINSFALLTIYPGTELFRMTQTDYNADLPENLEDWGNINRQNLSTPWTSKERDLYLYLQYSSHFLCSAKRYAAKHWFIPGFIFDLYSQYLKYIYKKKKLNRPIDYYPLKLLFKYLLKP